VLRRREHSQMVFGLTCGSSANCSTVMNGSTGQSCVGGATTFFVGNLMIFGRGIETPVPVLDLDCPYRLAGCRPTKIQPSGAHLKAFSDVTRRVVRPNDLEIFRDFAASSPSNLEPTHRIRRISESRSKPSPPKVTIGSTISLGLLHLFPHSEPGQTMITCDCVSTSPFLLWL
jgi:hypothetical protein